MFKLKRILFTLSILLIGSIFTTNQSSVTAEIFQCNITEASTMILADVAVQPIEFPCSAVIEVEPSQQPLDLINEHARQIEEAKRSAIDANLKGSMSGQSHLFYDRAIELELDPVFAIALANYETGNGSSYLSINKNNFGGMRSKGEWTSFKTKEDGIEAFLNLLVSYKERGADTPEKMASRYAPGSETWASNVKKQMSRINKDIENAQNEVISSITN